MGVEALNELTWQVIMGGEENFRLCKEYFSGYFQHKHTVALHHYGLS